MKSAITILLLMMVSAIYGQNYEKIESATSYGKSISRQDTILISHLLNKPEAFVGQNVIVKGMITDVCKMRGCWMKLSSDQEFQDITIKVKDGEIVFPLEAKGKSAVAEGTFEAVELSEEHAKKYLQHQAEEQGKEFDPKSVTGPIKIYRIKGNGAQIEK